MSDKIFCLAVSHAFGFTWSAFLPSNLEDGEIVERMAKRGEVDSTDVDEIFIFSDTFERIISYEEIEENNNRHEN